MPSIRLKTSLIIALLGCSSLFAWFQMEPPVIIAAPPEPELTLPPVAGPEPPPAPPEPTPAPLEPHPSPLPPRLREETTPVASPEAQITSTEPGRPTHVIAAGETLWHIAQTYDTTVEAIMIANRIAEPRTLQIGQELFIPDAGDISTTVGPIEALLVYEIRAGDTFSALAGQYGVTVEAVMAANPGLEPTALQIGQQILIPTAQRSAIRETTSRATVSHVIEAGDTLLALAIRYGLTVEVVMAANPGLEPTALQIGQVVTIPGAQDATMSSTAPSPTADEIAGPMSALETATWQAVNARREGQGLAAYQADAQLAAVARDHAQDMVRRDFFSHVTPEGITLTERLRRAGLSRDWTGENIQRNTQPAERAVSTALTWFMGSAPHRNNILHRHYTRLGVGVVEGPPGWYTFVLVFSE